MLQCAGVSATTGGDVMHAPLTPTTRTILLTFPMHACTWFGSSSPACAAARDERPRTTHAAPTIDIAARPICAFIGTLLCVHARAESSGVLAHHDRRSGAC